MDTALEPKQRVKDTGHMNLLNTISYFDLQ